MTIKYPFTIVAVSMCAIFLLAVTSASAYEFPPYEGLSLKIDGNVTESYSNNLTFTSDKENRIEDFMTMFTLGLNTRYEGKRNTFGFNGRLNRRIKTEASDIQNSSENLSLNVRSEISKYDIFTVNNNFTHTQIPGSFEDEFDMDKCRDDLEKSGKSLSETYAECNRFKEEFGRFKGRYDKYSNNLNFVYDKSISEQFRIGTSYSYGQNWSNQEGTQDSYRNNLNLRVNYMPSDITRFSLSYGHANSKYESGNNISTNSINAGVSQYMTRRLRFNGTAGVIFTPDTNNSSFGASLTNEIDEKTFASLSYSKTANISSDTENIFRNWQVTGDFKRQLSEDLNSSISVFYGVGEYDPWGIKDTFVGGSASLKYNFWKNKRGAGVNGRLGYAYSELNSTNNNRDYDRIAVNSTLTLVF